MKKLFFLLVMTVGMLSYTKAQQATLMPLKAGDTLVTVGALDSVTKIIPITAGYSGMGIQVVLTELSGTTACKAYLYGSLDGTNYIITDSSAAFTDQTTNTASFSKTSFPYTYIKAQVRNIGGNGTTFSGIARFYYVLRRYDHN